jgi:hypothetical protein
MEDTNKYKVIENETVSNAEAQELEPVAKGSR